MSNMQWPLEVLLIGLLLATLFHALRLEKALGVLRRDRAALEELVTGFNDSTRQAEGGIDRLRAVADGAGRQIARQVDQAKALPLRRGTSLDPASREPTRSAASRGG